MSVLVILCAGHADHISSYPAIPIRLGWSLSPLLMTVSVLIKLQDFTLFFVFSYHLGYKLAASTEHHLAIIAEMGLGFLFEKWSDAILSCYLENLFITDETG